MKVTYEAVQEMTKDELDGLANKHKLYSLFERDFDSLGEMRDAVCEALDLSADADEPDDPNERDAGIAVGKKMDEYLDTHSDATESQALAAVLRANPDLAAKYRDSFGGGKGKAKTVVREHSDDSRNAGEEVDTRVQELLDESKVASYSEGLSKVLAADSDLRQRYEESFIDRGNR